jgi:hypothetical protein
MSLAPETLDASPWLPADESSGAVTLSGVFHMAWFSRRQSVRWCCPSFKAAVDNGGNLGFSVSITRPFAFPPWMARPDGVSDAPMGFYLRFRFVNDHLMSLWDYFNQAKPVLFCPWCGVNLPKRYGRCTNLPFSEGPDKKFLPPKPTGLNW